MSDPLSKEATATAIAGAVMSGKVKAAAVVDATLKRIAASEPAVNAFTDIVAERAKKRAAEIDAGLHRGPLLGVPFAVTNLFDIEGLPAFESEGKEGEDIIPGGFQWETFPCATALRPRLQLCARA